MWDNRLLTTIAYYQNRCDNQLIPYNLSSQTGFYIVTANLPASIQNAGIEINVSGDIIASKQFKWSVGTNVTIPRNKVLSFPNILASLYASVYTVGQPVTLIKGYHSRGMDAKGIYTFVDQNGDNQLDNKDYVPIANLAPKFYGGLSNHLSFKGIDLNILFEFKKQTGENFLGYVYSPGESTPGFLYNQPDEVLSSDKVQKFTQTTYSDAYNKMVYISSSDVAYSDASYIRLKNLSLSYDLSSLLNRSTKVRVFILGQNLLTITNFKVSDPETQGIQTLPPLRTITAGLQVAL